MGPESALCCAQAHFADPQPRRRIVRKCIRRRGLGPGTPSASKHRDHREWRSNASQGRPRRPPWGPQHVAEGIAAAEMGSATCCRWGPRPPRWGPQRVAAALAACATGGSRAASLCNPVQLCGQTGPLLRSTLSLNCRRQSPPRTTTLARRRWLTGWRPRSHAPRPRAASPRATSAPSSAALARDGRAQRPPRRARRPPPAPRPPNALAARAGRTSPR